MTTPTTPRRAIAAEAAVSGALAAAWYAMADVVRSRRARAVLKAALLVAGGAWGATAARDRDDDDARRGGTDGAAEDASGIGGDDAAARIRALTSTTPHLDASTVGLDPTDHRPGGRAVRLGLAAAAALTVTTGVTVAMERTLYRWGERRRAAGVRAAHTRIGVVAGVLTAAVSAAAGELDRRRAGGGTAAG